MQLSNIIGSPVITPSGERCGYVTDARLTRDYRKLSCLLCTDEEEEEFCLPARAVLSFADAVVAGRARLASPVGVPNPLGSAVYAHTGEYLGTASELFLQDAPELIVSKDGAKTAVPVPLMQAGATVVVYPDPASREAAARTAKRGTKKRTVSAPQKAPMPAQEPAEPPTMSEKAPMPEDTPMPENAPMQKEPNAIRFLDRTNLLGRRVKRSVYGANGEPIALAGERVTPAVLSAARRHNKLLALTVSTLTTAY